MKKTRTELHVLRAKQRITQAQLLKRIALHLPPNRGMSQGRYSQIENGVGPVPTPADLKAIAAALGVSVNDIAWPFEVAKAS